MTTLGLLDVLYSRGGVSTHYTQKKNAFPIILLQTLFNTHSIFGIGTHHKKEGGREGERAHRKER